MSEELPRLLESLPENDPARRDLAAVSGLQASLDTEGGVQKLRSAVGIAGGAGGMGAGATVGLTKAKLVSVVVLGTVAVGGGAATVSHFNASPPAKTRSTVTNPLQAPAVSPPIESSNPPEAVLPAPPEPQPETRAAMPTMPTQIETEPTARKKRLRPGLRGGGVKPATSVTVEPVPADFESVRSEAQLLAQAWRQLELTPKAALETLDGLASQFPAGVLVEERRALRVMALERLGRDKDARAAAQEFLEAYPGGPFSARVRTVLQEK